MSLRSPCRCGVKDSDCPNKDYPRCIDKCQAMELFRTTELDTAFVGRYAIDYNSVRMYPVILPRDGIS